MKHRYISLSATIDKKAISMRGYVSNIGKLKLNEILEKNTYLQELYPNDRQDILEVFCIDKAEGEYYDISDPEHVKKETFLIGEEEIPEGGYYVTDTYILCGTCYAVCPKQCIDTAKDPVVIKQKECIQRGECMQVCPVQEIMRKESLL